MFTRFAYQIGIRRNRYLIVQQQWLREGFSKMFGLSEDRFIVAPPQREQLPPKESMIHSDGHRFTFLFAATADVHKNFELLTEATRILEQRVGVEVFRTVLTIDGTENKYAQGLHSTWGNVSSLDFAGFMSRDKLQDTYASTDCLVFPSRIETWGLPISEFLPYNRPMLLSDLPFAHETAAGASAVGFFDPSSSVALADAMERVLRGDHTQLHPVPQRPLQAPSARSWSELFELLLSDDEATQSNSFTQPTP